MICLASSLLTTFLTFATFASVLALPKGTPDHPPPADQHQHQQNPSANPAPAQMASSGAGASPSNHPNPHAPPPSAARQSSPHHGASPPPRFQPRGLPEMALPLREDMGPRRVHRLAPLGLSLDAGSVMRQLEAMREGREYGGMPGRGRSPSPPRGI